MSVDHIDSYLARLRVELGRRGLVDLRIVEEARGHLADAAEHAIQRGLSVDAAQQEAIERFGSTETVAANFAAERYRRLDQLVFAVAVLAGLAIAYADSRPNWDDTGVTAFGLVFAGGALGLVAPRRPWLWAVAVGVWIPVHAFATSPHPASLMMLIVLAFPFAGACAGMALRRVHAMLPRSGGVSTGEFHDQPDTFHFVVKSKRGWINPELAAIVADPETKLVPFLERIAPKPLGPLGELQSLTVVDGSDGSAARTRKYQAVFGDEGRISCTIEIGGGGRHVSVHWSRATEPG